MSRQLVVDNATESNTSEAYVSALFGKSDGPVVPVTDPISNESIGEVEIRAGCVGQADEAVSQRPASCARSNIEPASDG
jgi:hypothetical protein